MIDSRLDSDKAKEMLNFNIKAGIIRLSKQQLEFFDEIRDEHEFMLQKLKNAIPKEYHDLIDAANYIDDNRHGQWRKRTLDSSNDEIRHLRRQTEQFNINFLT